MPVYDTLVFDLNVTDASKLNVLDNPGRNDSQGPRLASNVEVIVTDPQIGTPDTPAVPAVPDSYRTDITADSQVLEHSETDGLQVVRSVLTTTTRQVLVPGTPEVPAQPGTPGSPGEQYVRIHSRQSVDRRLDGGTGWASGGITLGGQARTYGRYTARLRASESFGTRVCWLLWTTGDWPFDGEIDIKEIGADYPARDRNTLSCHYADPAAPKVNKQWVRSMRGDFTQWHDYELIWAPDLIQLSVDGVVTARGTDHIPVKPMFPGFQTAQGRLAAGQERTAGTFDIASFRIYGETA